MLRRSSAPVLFVLFGFTAACRDADPDGAGSSASESVSGSESGDGDGDGDGDGEPAPGECTSPIAPVEPSDARLRLGDAGQLHDALDRRVVMRGLNTGNRNKTPPYVPFPITDDIPLDEFRVAADEFFARMHAWGMDTARLPFSWAALEPARDVWDERYLDRYEVMVDAAWAAGLRVIVDFHQDIWAERYCGDGFPDWTVPDPDAPAHACPVADWGLKYLTDAEIRGAFDRFWADEDQLQAEFEQMWTKVAERLGDHPGVVALEILNEPGWGSSNAVQDWKLEVLTPWHEGVIAFLHELAPNLLIVYDNPGLDGVALFDIVHPRPAGGDFLVYGPHLYGAATYGPDVEDPGYRVFEYADFGRTEGVHVLLGEFGFQPHEEQGPAWLTDVAESLDLEHISATLWEYSLNDPLWNFENFSVVDAAGNEQVMLDAWVRPWLRAVSGQAPYFEWDAAAGIGYASWVSEGEVSEIILPPRLFGAGPSTLEVGGEGACYTLDMDRGQLRVLAPAGVGVTVDFAL